MAEDDFRVRFGKVARTVEYDDAQGHLIFTVDGGSHGPKSLCLEHYAAQGQRVPHYGVAFNRVKEFLSSCGYQIDVSGDFAPVPPIGASDITDLIRAELATIDLPENLRSLVDGRLMTPTLCEFKLHSENATWAMWLVLEEPIHGLKVVFDHYSNQFGVVERDIFLGFEGTFLQTLNAISKVG